MKICVLDAATLGKDIDVRPIEKCGELVIYDLTLPHQVKERIGDVDVIITNKVILNEENLKDAAKLKLIALTATGYNNIDTDYAEKAGIGVANVAGYSTKSVAQHTFAMLFYMMEHLKDYDEYVKNKYYTECETFAFIAWPFHELANKTIGIIGMGAIGKEVAKIADAFGAKIIYYSTSGENNSSHYKRVDLKTLLRESDIITIHAPLNDNTRNLIGYNELAQMKREAILLNLGRGSIVVEADLAKALNENMIGAAALDVLEKEPITKDNPLFQVEDKSKLLITPHIGWASVEARELLIIEVVKNIEAYFNHEVRNRVV
ncbi:MAG: Glyoxylate reductase [Clostridia bacterium]|jgi:glycerate dehydrogenase|nr:Glyoxylate reductase [Clostridia bacterium]